MAFCVKCNNQNAQDARFCNKCGTPAAAAPAQAAPKPPAPPPPLPKPPAAPPPVAPKPATSAAPAPVMEKKAAEGMEIYRRDGECLLVNLRNVTYICYYQKDKKLHMYFNYTHADIEPTDADEFGDEHDESVVRNITFSMGKEIIKDIELKDYVAIVSKMEAIGGMELYRRDGECVAINLRNVTVIRYYQKGDGYFEEDKDLEVYFNTTVDYDYKTDKLSEIFKNIEMQDYLAIVSKMTG